MSQKNTMDEPLDPPLAPECERALENWICSDPGATDSADSARSHIEECASCRALAESIRFDQDLLRWQLERYEPPPAPRLALREPLRSASGHPRRVSLTLLPFLLGVILVLLLGVELMLGSIQNSMSPQIPDRTRTVLQIQKIERALARRFSAPTSPASVAPPGWEAELWNAELEASEPGREVPARMRGITFENGVFLDPYGAPYRLEIRGEPYAWRLVSAGPDGEFGVRNGETDDLDARSLSREE